MSNFDAMDLLKLGRTTESIEIPGADNVSFCEFDVREGISDDIAFYATGRVGEFMFVLVAQTPVGEWGREDVVALVARQAQRLQQPVH